jgi:hypothetical protein
LIAQRVNRRSPQCSGRSSSPYVGLRMHLPHPYCALLLILLCSACTTPPSQRTGPPRGNQPSTPGTASGMPPATAPGTPQGTPPGAPPSGTAPPLSTVPFAPITAPFFEQPSIGAAALNEGIAAFQRGEYGRANDKLKLSFLQGLTNTPDLLRGYKTTAFLNCVTQRIVQCEKSFEAAIAVDRKFDLSPSERGHPAWGPVFAKVRKRFPA